MSLNSRILSDLAVYSKYAQHVPELGRRESFSEIVERNKDFWTTRHPDLKSDIDWAYSFVEDRRVLPSMRSFQFAGRALEKSNIRAFNCSYLPIEDYRAFAEIMFLLLSGVGVGFSVQNRHVYSLPPITQPGSVSKYIINDSIEGWADAVRSLMKAYLVGTRLPRFDYGDIRKKGEKISSGGLAPGPEPLRRALEDISSILRGKLANEGAGSKLTSLECHDIICLLSQAVLAGGVRRSALISMFSPEDTKMLNSKNWDELELNPQRYLANNSAVLNHKDDNEYIFRHILERTALLKSGEPGIIWTNNEDYGFNPCVEAALRPHGLCNLTEIYADVESQKELNDRACAATIIGTLQAGLTDFHYLNSKWKKTAERDALLGVSLTGIASESVLRFDLAEAARCVVATNAEMAQKLGIRDAARLTCVKPSGTTSIVMGCSAGIHAWHSQYFYRRMRMRRDEALPQHLLINFPEIVEESVEKPGEELIVKIPISIPEGAKTVNEDNLTSLFPRIKRVYNDWIKPGHKRGDNTHNISCTVNVGDDEWPETIDWLWENRDSYMGISLFPKGETRYIQAPNEEITKDEYERATSLLRPIDLREVKEITDNTKLELAAACSGGACELTAV